MYKNRKDKGVELMTAIERLRKLGYKQRYNSNNWVRYVLQEEYRDGGLPDTIVVNKGMGKINEISFFTEEIKTHTFLGNVRFFLYRIARYNKSIKERSETKISSSNLLIFVYSMAFIKI